MAIDSVNSNGTAEPALNDQPDTDEGASVMGGVERGLDSLTDASQVSDASGMSRLKGMIGREAYACIGNLFKVRFNTAEQSMIVEKTGAANAAKLVEHVATNVATAVFTLLTDGLKRVTRVSVQRVIEEVRILAGPALEAYIREAPSFGRLDGSATPQKG